MIVPDQTLTITKLEGATRQIEAAIKALQNGDFDVAITLAGAAEGMFERDGLHLFRYLRDHESVAHVPKAEWISLINSERDWLKHVAANAPDTLELTSWEAALMIARAASKLPKWTPAMDEFETWFGDTFFKDDPPLR